jgi:hypothetical protein
MVANPITTIMEATGPNNSGEEGLPPGSAERVPRQGKTLESKHGTDHEPPWLADTAWQIESRSAIQNSKVTGVKGGCVAVWYGTQKSIDHSKRAKLGRQAGRQAM